MLKSSLVLLLFAVFSVHSFEPLRILIIRPDDGNFFPDKLERALQTGVAKIQEAINVEPLIDNILRAQDVYNCLQLDSSAQQTGIAKLVSSNEVNTVILNQNIVLNRANFAILLEINKERCDKESELMASANPCYVRDGHRPVIARIRVCPQLNRWMDFLESNTASDVFRHELLHALGWGTVVPSKNATSTPKDVSLKWNVGAAAIPVVRKFLDFGNTATEFARIHFSCSQLEGIETEREDKMHLSEYIFGNELMTPVISTSANYFTEISARILEETHLGPRRWYSVNRSIIGPETAVYSYGRGWGCEFVVASCFDYINLRLRQRRSTFPFCSSADYGRSDHSLHICSSRYQRDLKCDHLPIEPQDKSSNGLTPQPLSNIFPGLPVKFAFRMPSNAETRFCPFIQAISMDVSFSSPPIDEIRPC
ncbi:hypothetical protein PENTCL1PPCAC_6875 [Pristionchus entomophagus]|uniref:Leishmanolysin-like peptidase n=1 Tax=Pristionchus entomophagus TaxID=358040 RepID=A0AAV5SQ18_9BILA|nr:hypothetical protein PENTCL1PPCAC_6875 [Pristionchus entomophagus]